MLLVFDEVVTGFRLAYGGAQQYYGVVPDLAAIGKIVGGGFPLAAVCGAEELMRPVSTSRLRRTRLRPGLSSCNTKPRLRC